MLLFQADSHVFDGVLEISLIAVPLVVAVLSFRLRGKEETRGLWLARIAYVACAMGVYEYFHKSAEAKKLAVRNMELTGAVVDATNLLHSATNELAILRTSAEGFRSEFSDFTDRSIQASERILSTVQHAPETEPVVNWYVTVVTNQLRGIERALKSPAEKRAEALQALEASLRQDVQGFVEAVDLLQKIGASGPGKAPVVSPVVSTRPSEAQLKWDAAFELHTNWLHRALSIAGSGKFKNMEALVQSADRESLRVLAQTVVEAFNEVDTYHDQLSKMQACGWPPPISAPHIKSAIGVK